MTCENTFSLFFVFLDSGYVGSPGGQCVGLFFFHANSEAVYILNNGDSGLCAQEN